MSLYDDASLIMFPSGYKEDKIYSLKPTDGSGDLTFTRASTATRVNADGLIEKVRTNVFPYSQDLSNAAWITLSDGGSITKTANAGTAPDGTNTASRVQVAGGGTYNLVYQDSVNPLGIVVISGYFKRYGGTNQTFRLFGDNGNAYSGTLTATDTWQRFSFVMNASSTGGDGLAADALNNAYDVLVWGMQLETGDIATDYIPTTSAAVSVGMLANVARIDYTGGGCAKLLLESQRTNLALYSEQIDNAVWTKRNITISANSATSPDGYTNADKIQEDTSNDRHDIYQDFSCTSGTTYTISAFVKAAERTFCFLSFGSSNVNVNNAFFNLSTGAVVSSPAGVTSTITSYGNGWYRITSTATASGTGVAYVVNGPTLNASGISYQGVSGSGFLVYGYGAEAGSYATSYIPTLASSVTRLADAASKTGISSLIGQTEGTVFFEFTVKSVTQPSDPVLWYMKDGGSGQRYVELYSNSNLVYAEIDGGGLIAQITKTGLSVGSHKCAVAYAPNDMTFYVDGVQVGTDTSGTPSGFSTFGLQYYLSTYTGQQMVNQAVIFPTRLTNTQLATLTTL